MDRIKKLKIKKQDGTFSDYIPIGADAENIDTTDGESVETKLNKKPYYYNSVADMKADTKLKAGDMAITLGKNSFNDGLGGFYKIRNLTNNDVVDNVSIIPLNNSETLIAELVQTNYYILSSDYLDITSEDNSEAFNKMIDDALLYNKSIIIKNGNYKFKKHIVMASTVHILGEGKVVFDFSEFNDDTDFCVKITQKVSSFADSFINNPLFQNITFKGYPLTLSGLPLGYLNKNLFFIETHEFILSNLTIYGFNKAFTYGSNSYCINVTNSMIIYNNYGIYYDRENYTNSGERISFTNCNIANNNVALFINRSMFTFINCSFDYNKKIAEKITTYYGGVSEGHINFTDCHFEDTNHDNSIDRFICDEASIQFTGCGFWFGSLPFFKSLSNVDKLLFKNCLIRNEVVPTEQIQNNYFVETDYNNVSIDGLFTRSSQNIIRFSKYYNLINQTYNTLINNIQDGTISLEDGILTLTNDPYKSSYTVTDYINIPKGKTTISCTFDLKSNEERTGYLNFIDFYDDSNTLISSVSQNYSASTDYTRKVFVIPIPANAEKCKMYFRSPGGSNAIANIKNIYSSFN